MEIFFIRKVNMLNIKVGSTTYQAIEIDAKPLDIVDLTRAWMLKGPRGSVKFMIEKQSLEGLTYKFWAGFAFGLEKGAIKEEVTFSNTIKARFIDKGRMGCPVYNGGAHSPKASTIDSNKKPPQPSPNL
jgi:hypothetical protein